MSAPVWVLSVDMQTKTAAFTSGMSEAAKSARSAFTDIKTGGKQMGSEVEANMGVARHGVMLLTEEFGVHLPRGLVTFIAELGPVGAAMEAAFPFLAIILGATLLLEHLAKMHEAGEKLTSNQIQFGTAAQNAFNKLDDKLLQAGIRADELRGNHLAALKKQLELIDHQSMAELAATFGELAKASEATFASLKTSWYSFDSGSAGAKQSLDSFKDAYDGLLAKHDDKGAAALLDAKIERETRLMNLQKQARDAQKGGGDGSMSQEAAQKSFAEATNELAKVKVGLGNDAVASQQKLVEVLNDQKRAAGEILDIKAKDQGNATLSTAKEGTGEAAAAARAAIESQLRIGEEKIAADRATAAAQLSIQRASADDREAVDVGFAERDTALQLAANAKMMGALDRLSKDYPNELKALHEKAEEITQAGVTKIAEITSHAETEAAQKSIATLEQSERQKIDATRQGSAARLAAIGEALHKEQSLNLQDTSFYRELENQRVEVIRQAAEEEAKIKADSARIMADSDEKMGQLAIAAAREHQQLIDSSRRMTDQQRMSEEVDFANREYALQLAHNARDVAALDKGGKDYTTKLVELQQKQKQLIQQHEDEVTAIKEKAEIQRNKAVLAAENQAATQISAGLTQSIMGHQTWAHMVTSFASQAASGLIEHSLMVMMQQDKERLGNARTAATSAYKTGEGMGPAGIVLGPVFAAAAFAGVMAFQSGTDYVPGIGSGDHVPAMLEPGEGVVPGGVMDGLRKMANSGSMGGDKHFHAHVAPVYHLHALDSDGMEKILAKHSDTITKHVGNTLRKMNH